MNDVPGAAVRTASFSDADLRFLPGVHLREGRQNCHPLGIPLSHATSRSAF
jgi:hypothetical protein